MPSEINGITYTWNQKKKNLLIKRQGTKIHTTI